MRFVPYALGVGLGCFVIGTVVSLAGWVGGPIIVQGGVVSLAIASAIVIVGRHRKMQRAEPLVRIRHRAGARALDFPPRRFHHAIRWPITGAFALLTAA